MTVFSRLSDALDLRTSGKWIGLSVMIGVLAGLAATAFNQLTMLVVRIGLLPMAGFVPSDAVGEPHILIDDGMLFHPWWLVGVMTIGGLISGLLVRFVSGEIEGAGLDAAIFAFHRRKGEIDGKIAPLKLIASAITLGTGGSAGREGPISQIGAALGSWLSTRMKLSGRDRRILLAAGMAAGVGAVFRAPLAGALFAAEILYSRSDFEADAVIPAASSSIIAYSIYCLTLPEDIRYSPLFGHELADLLEPAAVTELLPYTFLAILLAAVGVLYVKAFSSIRKLFRYIPGPRWIRPGVGAFLAGVIGVGLWEWFQHDPQTLGVLGTGYGTLQDAVTHAPGLGVKLLFAVAFVKVLTTSLTVASGGSGGVFGPSMVVGGCFSAAVGLILNQWIPEWVPSPEAFCVVGMAGFFAGAARAPFSTIIMVSELTGGYDLLLPTMWVSTLCFTLSGRFGLYPSQVPTRVESPAHRGDFLVDVLEGLRVEEVYDRQRTVLKVTESTPMEQIVKLLSQTSQHYFPVVDDAGKLIGIFTDDDVRGYLYDSTLWTLANARDVMSNRVTVVTPEDDLNTAIQAFTLTAIDELPVVSAEDRGEMLGTIRQKDAVAAYNDRVREIKIEMAESV